MGLETRSPEERELVETNVTEGGGAARINFRGPVYFEVTSFALLIHICTVQAHLFLCLERYQFY